ncbi:MAG: halocarboxylic acid dehydrogenase DehI family protein [Methylobacter sp.]|uniref:halocarboxylic acid dehydrogenase DehI family protein n=1 Tax=Methylobacter sp. TaxID=2051955 RepID=UPI00258729EC|nr:halocarboxylic acid dehydrogenase DehI family protein [Methylobacter sp.]MCL7419736.1 halocarboxylic acid dehydrogenase DehI family protein [Methylobacter sp.]
MVFWFGGPKQVAETEAEDEIERVYHEIKQSLRVSGINLNFRTWAGFEKFFLLMWDAMRPLAETWAFENAADEIRRESVNLAGKLGKIDAKAQVNLGESQKYQIKKALALYHYINPKLLVFTAKVKQALAGETPQSSESPTNTVFIERGIPVPMYPMEMIAAEPEDKRLAAIFEDIKDTLSLSSINSDYRTLGLWPDYLDAAWHELKPIVLAEAYQKASDQLRETAREQAKALPAISLSKQQIEDLGEDTDEILETTEKFEQLLPSLMINISLLSLDWKPADVLLTSPFPAESKPTGQGGTGR